MCMCCIYVCVVHIHIYVCAVCVIQHTHIYMGYNTYIYDMCDVICVMCQTCRKRDTTHTYIQHIHIHQHIHIYCITHTTRMRDTIYMYVLYICMSCIYVCLVSRIRHVCIHRAYNTYDHTTHIYGMCVCCMVCVMIQVCCVS